MGSYIAIHVTFPAPPPNLQILAGLFESGRFRPVALGALAPRRKGANWFLAGWGLEPFVTRYVETLGSRRAGIRVSALAGGEQKRYLGELSSVIRARRACSHLLSPNEGIHPEVPVTLLAAPALAPAVLDECESWPEGATGAEVNLYGTFDTRTDGLSRHFENAFRSLLPPPANAGVLGIPLLFATTRIVPREPPGMHVTLFSEARIWLAKNEPLEGHVRAVDADGNLAGLVEVAGSLVKAAPGARPSVVYLEGSVFRQEAPRFRDAFARIGSEVRTEQ